MTQDELASIVLNLSVGYGASDSIWQLFGFKEVPRRHPIRDLLASQGRKDVLVVLWREFFLLGLLPSVRELVAHNAVRFTPVVIGVIDLLSRDRMVEACHFQDSDEASHYYAQGLVEYLGCEDAAETMAVFTLRTKVRDNIRNGQTMLGAMQLVPLMPEFSGMCRQVIGTAIKEGIDYGAGNPTYRTETADIVNLYWERFLSGADEE